LALADFGFHSSTTTYFWVAGMVPSLLKFGSMNRWERIGIIISAVWIIVLSVIAMQSLDALQFFLIAGVLPIVIGWGMYWIQKAK
jgi:hypothetical protein